MSACPEESATPGADGGQDVQADLLAETGQDASGDLPGDEASTPDSPGETDSTPDSVTPDNGPDSVTPDNGPDSVTPDNGPDSVTPDNGPDSVTPDSGPDIEVVQPPTLTLGAVELSEFCPGTELSIEVTVAGDAAPYEVDVELSDESGDFADAVVIGSASITGVSPITCTIPQDAQGAGYRIRAISQGTASADNGADLTVLGQPQLSSVRLIRRDGIAGSTKPFGIINDATAQSWSWSLGAGATPETSDLKSPQWTYDTTGTYSVSLTATSAQGCIATKTLQARVFDCDSAVIGPDTTVAPAGNDTIVNPSPGGAWLCYGADVTLIGGDSRTTFLEPGSTLSPINSEGVIFAPAGSAASLLGLSDGNIVFYEEGAALNPANAFDAKLCADIVYDRSNAPANGCTTEGALPFAATVGALPPGNSCPSGDISVPYTTDSAPGTNNLFIVELSDDTGDFASHTIIGVVPSSAPSGTLDVTLPADMQASSAYKLRIRTTDPPGLGPDSAETISIGAPLNPTFSKNANHALSGQEIAFTLTSTDVYDSLLWEFGPDATPSTSTDPNPVITFGSNGQKTMTLTMVAPGGCEASLTKTNLEIFSCNPTAPGSSERVVEMDVNATGNGPFVGCGGATMTVYSAQRTYLLPGSGAEFYTDDDMVVYAAAGAGVTGDSFPKGVLIADDEANLGDVSGFASVLICDDLQIDDSAVPGTCPPFTPQPNSLSLDEGADTDWCPGEAVTIPYTLTGQFPPGSDVRLRRSDATGDFTGGPILDTDYGAYSGAFEFTAPNVPPGTYQIRPEIVLPSFIGEGLAATVYAGPTAAFSPSAKFMMEGDSVTFTDESTGDGLTYQWTFPGGTPSTATGPDPGPITFAAPGAFSPQLTVTNAGGCSNTVDDYSDRVEAFTCNPVLPANTALVANQQFGLPILVCSGQSGTDIGGKKYLYIESGGTYEHDIGGVYVGYVKAGGTFNASQYGGSVAIFEEGATVTNQGELEFSYQCPALTFDTSQVTGPLCQ